MNEIVAVIIYSIYPYYFLDSELEETITQDKIKELITDKDKNKKDIYRYLFNKVDGAALEFYCMDFTNESKPKISTISINRRTNTIGVTNFQPLWEIATESEVNNAVDNIFKTI